MKVKRKHLDFILLMRIKNYPTLLQCLKVPETLLNLQNIIIKREVKVYVTRLKYSLDKTRCPALYQQWTEKSILKEKMNFLVKKCQKIKVKRSMFSLSDLTYGGIK
jgi:hypothetical protein